LYEFKKIICTPVLAFLFSSAFPFYFFAPLPFTLGLNVATLEKKSMGWKKWIDKRFYSPLGTII
jgi:hypothetical protein